MRKHFITKNRNSFIPKKTTLNLKNSTPNK